MPRKNPWIAAVLNFLLYGLGYIYNGKRIVFGAGLIVLGLAEYFLFFEAFNSAAGLALILLFSLLFAYDAYNEALELNKKSRKR